MTLYAPAGTIYDRLLRRVTVTPEGCWLFTGAVTSRGKGCVGSGRKGKSELAHRVAVLATGRTIPAGMTVDHLCHDSRTCTLDTRCPHRRCVRPEHLAVVTPGENTARRWESGLCSEGHPLAQRSRQRYCPTCATEYRRAWNAARAAS